MDLKIKDVAELLNVSETTIRRWLTDGKIPAYRLNHQYRFSRIEIENWMMGCKVDKERPFSPFENDPLESSLDNEPQLTSKGGTQQFSLYRALIKGDVLHNIEGSSKEEIISSTLKQLAPKLGFDAEVVCELFLDRERLMPTALGNGVAIPHSRDFLLKAPASDTVVIAFPKHPIEYGALDGKPVDVLFFMFSTNDKKHLHLLAKIAHLSSHSEAMEFLKTTPKKEAVLDFLRDWEGRIRQCY